MANYSYELAPDSLSSSYGKTLFSFSNYHYEIRQVRVSWDDWSGLSDTFDFQILNPNTQQYETLYSFDGLVKNVTISSCGDTTSRWNTSYRIVQTNEEQYQSNYIKIKTATAIVDIRDMTLTLSETSPVELGSGTVNVLATITGHNGYPIDFKKISHKSDDTDVIRDERHYSPGLNKWNQPFEIPFSLNSADFVNGGYSQAILVSVENDRGAKDSIPLILRRYPNITVSIKNANLNVGDTLEVELKNTFEETITVKVKTGSSTILTDTSTETTRSFDTAISWIRNSSSVPITIVVSAENDKGHRYGWTTCKLGLKALSLTVDKNNITTGGNVVVGLRNPYQVLSKTITVNDGSVEILSDEFTGASYTLTPTATWFQQTGNTNNQMSVTINVTDEYARTAYTYFTLNAGSEMFPSIGTISLTNVPAANMPNNYGYVAGFSKVKIAVPVTKPSIASSISSVKVSYPGSSDFTLSYNSTTHKYEGTTPQAITGATTFTITAIDSNGRISQKSASITNVTTLTPIGIAIDPYTVVAGGTAAVTISNNIGNYDYTAKIGKTIIASGTNVSASSFNVETSESMFPTDGSVTSQSAKITVTDKLGRVSEADFTISLPILTVSLNAASVLIGNHIQLTFGGTAGQTISAVFRNGSKNLYTWSGTSSTADVTCPKSWFSTAQITGESSMQVEVVATSGSRTATAYFTLSFPTLSVSANRTTVTAGQTITYTISNRESETLTLRYYYQSTSILQQTVSANSVTITNAASLFDDAGVTSSQSLPLTAKFTDSYGRSAQVAITVNASDSMKPTISSIVSAIVQPSPAVTTFPNTYIADVSKTTLTVTFATHTNASIRSAVMSDGSTQIGMTLVNGKYVGTTLNPLGKNTTFTVTLTDQRGMTAQSTHSITGVVPYSPPSIVIKNYYRCRPNGQGGYVADDRGEYCYVQVTYKFANVNNLNARNTSVTLGNTTITRSLANLTQTETYIFQNVDGERSYIITVQAIDSVKPAVVQTVRLSTAGVLMDFLSGGKGVGIGKVAEYQNMVEVNPQWEFKASVDVNGTLTDIGTALENLSILDWEYVTQ